MEYAIESAALFNPSMVPAIDQANVPPGSVRFVMSLRATGEGHISSIVFRRGLIDANGNVSVDAPGRYSRPLRATVPVHFEKAEFIRQLESLHAWTKYTQATLALLGDQFTRPELSQAINEIRRGADVSCVLEESNDALLAVSQANYRLAVPSGADITEVVIFPYSDNERRGIEDLRLVRFAGLAEQYSKIREKHQQQVAALADRDDVDFYLVVVFRTVDDRKKFLDALALPDNRFVDGKSGVGDIDASSCCHARVDVPAAKEKM
jgi:hypothetical protein